MASDAETGLLTAESALEIAKATLLELSEEDEAYFSKRIATALLQAQITALRECSKKRCTGCGQEKTAVYYESFGAYCHNVRFPYRCHAQFEQRRIAELTAELEALR